MQLNLFAPASPYTTHATQTPTGTRYAIQRNDGLWWHGARWDGELWAIGLWGESVLQREIKIIEGHDRK